MHLIKWLAGRQEIMHVLYSPMPQMQQVLSGDTGPPCMHSYQQMEDVVLILL